MVAQPGLHLTHYRRVLQDFYDVFFLNATVGYAAGTTTVDMWKTTDAGLTWTGPIIIPATTYENLCS